MTLSFNGRPLTLSGNVYGFQWRIYNKTHESHQQNRVKEEVKVHDILLGSTLWLHVTWSWPPITAALVVGYQVLGSGVWVGPPRAFRSSPGWKDAAGPGWCWCVWPGPASGCRPAGPWAASPSSSGPPAAAGRRSCPPGGLWLGWWYSSPSPSPEQRKEGDVYIYIYKQRQHCSLCGRKAVESTQSTGCNETHCCERRERLTLSVTLSTSMYRKFKFWSKCWSLNKPLRIIWSKRGRTLHQPSPAEHWHGAATRLTLPEERKTITRGVPLMWRNLPVFHLVGHLALEVHGEFDHVVVRGSWKEDFAGVELI